MDEHAWSGKDYSHFPKLSLRYWSSQFAVLQYLTIKSSFQPLQTGSYPKTQLQLAKTQLQLAWCGWCCVLVECWLVDKWARAENRGAAQFTRKNAVRKVQIAAAVDTVALTLIFTSAMHLFSSGYPFKGCSGAGVDAEHDVGYTLDGLQICFRTYTYNRPDLWMVRITSKPNTEHVSRLWGKQTRHRKASNWTLNPGPSHHCPGFTLYVVVRLLFFHRQVYPLVTHAADQSSKQDDVPLHYICVLLCLSKLPPRS